jgi:single-strand DNA-binding protein
MLAVAWPSCFCTALTLALADHQRGGRVPQVVQPQLLRQRIRSAVRVQLGNGLVRNRDGRLEAHRDERGRAMTEASVSFAGNLTDDPEVRYTEGGIARAMFRVAVSGRREQEVSFFTVVVWRDQAGHAAESLAKGQPGGGRGSAPAAELDREDGSARSAVEVLAEELGPSLRWATATTTRATRSQSQ